MKYLIIAFFFISGYNCQLIKQLGQTAQTTEVLWFKDMVKRMEEQLQGKQLQDMFLSPRAPYKEVIDELLNSPDIVKVTCVKLLTSPKSNVIDDIEVEVVKKNGESCVIQISTNDNNLATVTRKIATKEKNRI